MRRHVSERDANVAMGVMLALACVGAYAIARWLALAVIRALGGA